LKELDAMLSEELHLYCLGGFVVTLVHGFSSTTSDIDTLVVQTGPNLETLLSNGRIDSALSRKYGIYIDFVGIAKVPESYEGRLREIFADTFKHLRLFALDPYDLALSKLERDEQHDRDDVKYLGRMVPLDTALLRKRYQQELRWQLGNPAREDATLERWIEMIEEERQKS
jgi:predicted nucleotidyltransferase